MTDVQMPGEPDGLELARTFRARCPDCAIIVASGRVMPQAAELASGAVFVSKPYVGYSVVKTMNKLLTARC